MAIRDIFKFSRKTFINPSGWLDYDAVENQTRSLWTIIKSLMTPAAAQYSETYEEALARLGVTDEEAQHRGHRFKAYAILFVLLGFIVFFYTIYLLAVYKTFSGLILGLCAAAAFFCQAFRFDFWSFQIRSRRLGATFDEWKKNLLGDKGTP